jgi:hypothetical protein
MGTGKHGAGERQDGQNRVGEYFGHRVDLGLIGRLKLAAAMNR